MPCRWPSLAVLACLSLTATALAHGGGYRPPPPPGGPPPAPVLPGYGGPGDVTGPTTGGPGGPSGPSRPAPAGPASPTTGGSSPAGGNGGGSPARLPGPATGGPAGPAHNPPGPGAAPAPAGPATGPRGVILEEDRTTWEIWWELHRDGYLRLKDHVWQGTAQTGSDEFYLGPTRRVVARDAVRPTAADVQQQVLPALKAALDTTSHRDIVTACLMAMAKPGQDHADFRLVADVMAPRLIGNDQEIRETAALAIGLTGQATAAHLDLLAGLARDTAAGRTAAGQAEVSDRTRAFACYGLGLLASGSDRLHTRHRAATSLLALVQDRRLASRNVRVAAIVALGMLQPEKAEGAGADALRDLVVDSLLDYFDQDLGPGDEFMQSHCPPAVARLTGRDGPRADALRARFTRELARTERRRGAPITQSLALALGMLGRPVDDDTAPDFAVSDVLLRTWHAHPDAQTRYFAVVALGQIGGAWNRTALLRDLDRAGKALELPWLGLALGVHAWQRRQDGHVDQAAADALLAAMQQVRAPGTQAALALAVGLTGHRPAGDTLRGLLAETREDWLAGHLCIGLALLGDPKAQDSLRDVLDRSLRRPELLRQAAIGLSVLGDRRVAGDLIERLGAEANLARLAAIAGALGHIGDRRTIGRLIEVLGDTGHTALARAFAAAALGGIVDRHALPWQTAIRGHVNYRSAPETLWDGEAGVLDIL